MNRHKASRCRGRLVARPIKRGAKVHMAKKTESNEFLPPVTSSNLQYGDKSSASTDEQAFARRNPAPDATVPMVVSRSRKFLLTR